MQTLSLADISKDPSEFLHRVEAGETLVLMRDAQPMAAVKPLPSVPTGQCPYGLCAGEFVVPDDFNDLLPIPEIPK